MSQRHVLALVGILFGAQPVLGQAWVQTGADDPWGPYGSQVCSADPGDPDRFCIAVFCAEPGGPLALGYSNEPYFESDTRNLSVELNVDNLQSWQTTLTLQSGFGYLVGAVALDPGALPGLYQSIRAGGRLYLDDGAGNVWGLPLRRSDAEMQRLAGVCAPLRPLELNEITVTLIGPRRSDAPPEIVAIVEPDPDGPTSLEELNTFREPNGSNPSEALPSTDEGLTDTIAAETTDTPRQPHSAPGGRAIPNVPALVVGASDWQAVPPMGEPVFGTRLCFPETRGGAPDRCLNLVCFEGWRTLNILFEDAGFPADDWRGASEFELLLSAPSGASAALPLVVNPDAETLVAARLAQDVDWNAAHSILNRDGPLRIDLPYGASTVMAGNTAPEIARLLEQCESPG